MKLFQKITSVFLALVFTLSSLGFTIGKMECLKSGKTKISLSKVEDCCAKKKKQNCCNEEQNEYDALFKIKKADCCEISNTILQLKDFNPSQKKNVPAIDFCFLPYSTTFTISELTNTNKPLLSFADLPPPLHGRTLLNFISVLTI